MRAKFLETNVKDEAFFFLLIGAVDPDPHAPRPTAAGTPFELELIVRDTFPIWLDALLPARWTSISSLVPPCTPCLRPFCWVATVGRNSSLLGTIVSALPNYQEVQALHSEVDRCCLLKNLSAKHQFSGSAQLLQ